MNPKNNESQKFIKLETLGAYLLLGAALIALLLSNSPASSYYFNLFHADKFLFLINDGLMTIFFLVVGLEIKYELLEGALNSFRKAVLPGIAAMGGILVPALIYIMLNYYDHKLLRGWGVPIATDIAFALCILSLLGSKIPAALKIFLTTLAILDDLVAIIIIAIFYTDHLHFIFLGLAFIGLLFLMFLNVKKITHLSGYILIGCMLWLALWKSGIHPTLAGIALAFMIPGATLKKLQHRLHPWVALIVVPLFAFANAGISFFGLNADNLHLTLILGVFLGLFIGKQLGILGTAWLAVKLRIAALPDQVRWKEFYGVAIVAGIGFTISLFIGNLAFGNDTNSYLNSVKIGVLSGSLLSGMIGYLLLLFIHRKNN